MESKRVRQIFLDFFESKGHKIVASAPMVVKDDPTLMFNNSGMAPFKDIFLGNSPVKYPRIADTQKCLRVSGKHNDLEEVGVDTYHHTMFEMLGNWSFGDYFKKDALNWAWELLTEVYKLDKTRLYVTVFEGYEAENLAFDQESYDTWKGLIAEDRILKGNKKDNFWEMGDTGPCGPCSEIHIDLRDDEEREKTDGKLLVNTGHPQVIEIWNNVFMEFERKADGTLVKLPKQHVDTGMGFERLCVALQGKKSNYDTDVFQPLISFIEQKTSIKYGENEKTDIAMRVLSDHIRTISFAIAEGQLPGNAKAGYVIRRILRRAVRYYYTFLELKSPFMHLMVDVLVKQMGDYFPELKTQQNIIEKVLFEEEAAFLKTLGIGIQKFEEYIKKGQKIIDGNFAFELYDTYGFPIDLTQLLARENNLEVEMELFNSNLEKQKQRSRSAAELTTDDWVVLQNNTDFQFTGYNNLVDEVMITKYRKVKTKTNTVFHLVLNRSPFYAESGGQVGDTGVLKGINNNIHIINTIKENGIWIHVTDNISDNLNQVFIATVNEERRKLITNNHSATHLLHAALRSVLGTHVEQKGSLVNDEHLRFDFSHFEKVNDLSIDTIEKMVNEKIRENIPLQVMETSLAEAKGMGAMALFGEKYGEKVRVVIFDSKYSVELCGGTHVESTSQIGLFKITSESAVAAGIRRIEAVSNLKAEAYFMEQIQELKAIKELLKNPKSATKAIEDLIKKNAEQQKALENYIQKEVEHHAEALINKAIEHNGITLIKAVVPFQNNEAVKDLCFKLKAKNQNLLAVIGNENGEKANISIIIGDELMKAKSLNASALVRELAKEINGGGGGQPFFATAGGSNKAGLKKAIDKIVELL